MSFLTRSISRLASHTSKQLAAKHIGSAGLITQSQCSVQPLTRSLVILSTPSRMNSYKQPKPSNLCSCGCGIHGMHTKGDRELVEFLQDEIVAEKKSITGALPSKIGDFTIKQSKAELILNKTFNDEKITISVNVNHTVEAPEQSQDGNQENTDAPLSSRPDFEVDVEIGSKILSFTCQFTAPGEVPESENVEDVFGISELTIYDGEWDESTYCVSGDILDGMMYDLLMNMLDERGVSNDFAEKLSDLCTTYEHGLYVNMLQQVHDFVKRK